MVDENNYPRAYAEVYAFIEALGSPFKEKIPEDILRTIERERDKTYEVLYDRNQSLKEGDIQTRMIL